MRNKHLFLFAYTVLATLALTFTSCSSDDGDGNTTPSVDENFSVINMMKGSYENATKFGETRLYINESNNFAFDHCNYTHSIAPIGNVKGLSYISAIPKNGYTNDNTAVIKGYGYIYCDDGEELTRLFVEDAITDPAGNILGYKIAHETPFYGKNQDIKLPKYEVAFDSNGGCDTLLFTDGEPMIIDYTKSSIWCHVYKCDEGLPNYFPAYLGIKIYAEASDSIYATTDTITLETGYGKKETIKVTRGAAEPRLSFGEQSEYSLPVNGGTRSIRLDANIPLEKIEIDNSKAKWCEAKCGYVRDTYDPDYHYYKKQRRLILTTGTNETGEKRSGSITLKYKDGTQSATINVVQDAPYFECDYNTENYYSTGCYSDNIYISYKSNIENLKAESNVDWINGLYFNYYNGLRFYCESNYSEQSREGIITISDESGKVIHSIKVVQAAW